MLFLLSMIRRFAPMFRFPHAKVRIFPETGKIRKEKIEIIAPIDGLLAKHC